MEFSAVFTIDSIRGTRLEVVELLEERRQQMVAMLVDAISDSCIHHDVQIILEQYLNEYHEVKKSVTSILTHLDALEQELHS